MSYEKIAEKLIEYKLEIAEIKDFLKFFELYDIKNFVFEEPQEFSFIKNGFTEIKVVIRKKENLNFEDEKAMDILARKSRFLTEIERNPVIFCGDIEIDELEEISSKVALIYELIGMWKDVEIEEIKRGE